MVNFAIMDHSTIQQSGFDLQCCHWCLRITFLILSVSLVYLVTLIGLCYCLLCHPVHLGGNNPVTRATEPLIF